MTVSYGFARVSEADLPLISRWRARPHVRRWWGGPEVEQEVGKLADPRIAMWIVSAEGRPFAFMQDYDVHGWDLHPFAHLPPGSRGLDFFIGEPDMIGQGHGPALLHQHCGALQAAGAPAFGIDPNPGNAQAIRAFEKAGFEQKTGPVSTPWGTALLMEYWPV